MKNNKWETEEINYLLSNYKGKTNKQLSLDLSRSVKAVEIKLARLGLTRPKIHIQNNNAFSDIKTSEQAYWLGFLTADGFLNYSVKNGIYELGIELQLRDKKHLEKFKDFLESNAVIIERKRYFKTIAKRQSNKEFYSARLRIYSKPILDDLIKLKIYPNKTHNGIYYIKDLPEDLHRDYIRGFFDGDGSISWKTNHKHKKYIACNFTSIDENFLKDIQAKLYENGIYSHISSWNNQYNNTTYQLGLTGAQNCLKFLNYMYDNSNTYLDRKYLLFKNATLNSDV